MDISQGKTESRRSCTDRSSSPKDPPGMQIPPSTTKVHLRSQQRNSAEQVKVVLLILCSPRDFQLSYKPADEHTNLLYCYILHASNEVSLVTNMLPQNLVLDLALGEMQGRNPIHLLLMSKMHGMV